MENLPEDVAIVMAYLWTKTPVGSETYKRIEETVKKYPDYFPWETKYNSIDESVHRAYENEKELLYKSFFPQTKMDIQPGEGIYAWSKRRSQEVISYNTPVDWEELSKSMQDRQKRDEDFSKAKKKLRIKHYKKFNLKYQQ